MPTTLAPIVEKALPAVVNISSTRIVQGYAQGSPFSADPFFRYFFGDPFGRRMPQERREQSLGSGVIISPDGYVITNNHVIQGGEGLVQVTVGGDAYEAKVVGLDAKTDVALLKIDAPEALHHLEFGNSLALRAGDFVIAIGNPFGLDQTVTMGIVSAVGRADVGIADYEDFIQTDAAINPGNSGGALLNLDGELIGINTAILSRSGGYQGIGFAVPSDMAERVVENLIEHGEVRRGWIGVAVQNLTTELAGAMGLEHGHGVLVSDVFEESPAARAGVEPGDIVVEVDGRKVTSVNEYRSRTERLLPGMTAAFTTLRDGARQVLRVPVERLPEEPAAKAFEEMESGPIVGAALETLSPGAAAQLGYPRSLEGVLITDVREGGVPARAGLRRGDIILRVDRVRVRSVDELASTLERLPRDTVLLLIQRGESRYYVALPRRG
jgi:serine protease Do